MSPHLSLDLLYDVRQLLAYQFMANALLAACAVATMAGAVGWFMVLRRETFAGHTLSLMSFPGASAAALAGAPAPAGYFVFCTAGALLLAAASPRTGGRDGDGAAATGAIQAGALAAGFLLLSLYGGVLEDLETLLFGSIVGVTGGQALTLALVAAAVLAFLAGAGRPLLLASVDAPLALVAGLPVRALNAAFLIVLGLAVAATAQVTGALLVFALLVAPAAIARELTPRIGAGLALSVVIAIAIAWMGLALSYFTDYSPGFFVTTLGFIGFAAARLAPVGARGRRRVAAGARGERREGPGAR